MLKCLNASFCVHKSEMCNGMADCPYGDDEYICKIPLCSSSCKCKGRAYICTRSNLTNSNFSFTTEANIWYLSVAENQLSFTGGDTQLQSVPSVRYLNFSYNLISGITGIFVKQTSLQILDLSHNNIQVLLEHSFSALGRLCKLLLAGNKIKHIYIHNVSNLRLLNSHPINQTSTRNNRC